MFQSNSKSGFSCANGVVREATEQEVAEYCRARLKELAAMIWRMEIVPQRRERIERTIAYFEAYLDREFPAPRLN